MISIGSCRASPRNGPCQNQGLPLCAQGGKGRLRATLSILHAACFRQCRGHHNGVGLFRHDVLPISPPETRQCLISPAFPTWMMSIACNGLAEAAFVAIDMDSIAPVWIITFARLIRMASLMQAPFQQSAFSSSRRLRGFDEVAPYGEPQGIARLSGRQHFYDALLKRIRYIKRRVYDSSTIVTADISPIHTAIFQPDFEGYL